MSYWTQSQCCLSPGNIFNMKESLYANVVVHPLLVWSRLSVDVGGGVSAHTTFTPPKYNSKIFSTKINVSPFWCSFFFYYIKYIPHVQTIHTKHITYQNWGLGNLWNLLQNYSSSPGRIIRIKEFGYDITYKQKVEIIAIQQYC